MAQGIPVGVLKAGSSFSANWTAFSLNTYRERGRERRRERVNIRTDFLKDPFYLVYSQLLLLNILLKQLTGTNIKVPTPKTNAGWRRIKQSEMSGDKQLLNDGHKSVRAQQIYGADSRTNICKTCHQRRRETLGGQTLVREQSERKNTAAVRFPLWQASAFTEGWRKMDTCSFWDYTSFCAGLTEEDREKSSVLFSARQSERWEENVP